MLLVHAETLENPYVAPRPFWLMPVKVNAYILLPEGKTAYLSDLAVGGQVLVSNATGSAKTAIIGRTKIENACRCCWLKRKRILQRSASSSLNAETISVKEDWSAISVVHLATGDRNHGVRT